VATGFSAGSTNWIGAIYDGATTVTFHTSTDGISWTSLGSAQTVTGGTLNTGTANVSVGQTTDTSSGVYPFLGKIFQAKLFASATLTGTPVLDFNPALVPETTTNGATWVAATGNGALGFLYLFVFSIGMTALLVAVGLFSGTLTSLPKAGAWMVWVKRGAGVIMLAMAQYYFVQAGMVW